jgi:hypothetical protein
MMRVAVYDNKIEKNIPYGICGPITCSDDCVKDNITVHYFDSAPFKTGLRDPCCQENDCACIPMTCCGPPVIFSHEKQYCCGLCCCASREGVAIRSTPCSVWNCKTYIICGKPCYLDYAEDFFELPLACATPPSVVFSLSPRVYGIYIIGFILRYRSRDLSHIGEPNRESGAAEFIHALKHALAAYKKVHPEIPTDQFAEVHELTTGSFPIIGRGRSSVVAPEVCTLGAPAMEMDR